MKKTFGLIALLASSSLALVSPALAHERQDNDGYRNQTVIHNRNNAYDNYNAYNNSYNSGYRAGYVNGSECAPDNRYVDARRESSRAREAARDRQWHRQDFHSREWR